VSVGPDLRGGDSYRGRTIHCAQWDAGCSVAGLRVAVIGTGAGVIRIVPELVRTADSVKVFQGCPVWVLPESMALGPVRNRPLIRIAERVARAHLHHQVHDPWLRRQLTPDARAGTHTRGARLLVSSDFYPALQRPNCKLITWPIATLSPAGVRTSDGIEHAVDWIVFATGSGDGVTPGPVAGRRTVA
jgi:cation diffusion facilitator CzcD-associated flavoprotein CzcO